MFSAIDPVSGSRKVVAVMPSGSKIRRAVKRRKGSPETRSTTIASNV